VFILKFVGKNSIKKEDDSFVMNYPPLQLKQSIILFSEIPGKPL